LTCITHVNGGEFYIASDPASLKQAFQDLGRTIQERVGAFSAPSVPSVELTTREKGYISTFFSINDRSVWEGHLRAYLVDPTTGVVPTTCDTQNGVTLCTPDTTEKLWDVGNQLAGLTNSDAGVGPPHRNLFYGTDYAVTSPDGISGFSGGISDSTHNQSPFVADSTNKLPLYNRVFGTSLASITTGSAEDTAITNIVSFIRGVRATSDLQLAYRYPYDPNSSSATTAQGRLGDIFHSVPVVTGTPDCFQCYQTDYGSTQNHSYRSFFSANVERRKVLFVGANDGMMHGIDAGFFNRDSSLPNQYDNGTGQELFGWLPNYTMPVLNSMTNSTGHSYTVDGTPTEADVLIDPANTGTADPASRVWRTSLIFGERQGGNSVVALDVTQPDQYSGTTPTSGANGMPSCLDGTSCNGAKYPRLLWEFSEGDTDGNGHPDLAQTWSRPAVALVKVQPQGATAADGRFVAIFGGGYDPSLQGGNYLYMVDIETGKPLLKLGSSTSGTATMAIPGEVGLLDANLDGFIERVYWTDTSGSIWRMDTTATATLDASGKIACTYSSADSATCGGWTAVRLFKATVGIQPIFHRPVIVLAGFDALGNALYAVGAGSGDRANIIADTPNNHAFYFVLDPGGTTGFPLTESNLQAIPVDSAAASAGTNYVINATTKGWYLELGTNEKVNTPAVAVNNQLIFSTFTPGTVDTVNCTKSGLAKTYVVDFLNANPPPTTATPSRYTLLRSDVLMASEPIIYVGEDGRLHVLQSLEAAAGASMSSMIGEPVAPRALPGAMVSWRERELQ
jgi:type IV pilus assembly protein PilY1